MRLSPALLVLAGCSAFGAESPVKSDAGPVGNEDGSTVAPDAGGGADAAAPVARCQSVPTGTIFCADFETDKPHFGFTDDFGAAPPAAFTAKRVPVDGRGQVLSYHATISSPSAGNGWLRFGPGGADADLGFKVLELSMDIAIVNQSFGGGIVAALWTLLTPGTPQVNGMASVSNGLALDGSTPRTTSDFKAVMPGEWHTIRVRLQPSGSSFERLAYVDEQLVDRALVPKTGATWDARIGMYYAQDGNAEILFDNVIVRRE